jgi:hypothetical protein
MTRDKIRPRPAGLTAEQIARRDRQRKAALKWCGLPPGMSPTLAQSFEKRISGGKTIKDLTNPQLKSFLVPESRFKKHCVLNPTWAEHIKKLNGASCTKKRKLTSGHGCRDEEVLSQGPPPDDEGKRSDRRRWPSSMSSVPLHIDARQSDDGRNGRAD